MNKTIKIPVLLFLLFAGTAIKINAQANTGKWQLGVNAGIFIYQGDLAPAAIGSCKTPSFTIWDKCFQGAESVFFNKG